MIPSFISILQKKQNLNQYLHNVKDWMSNNKLKCSPGKTEFIVFGTKQQQSKLKSYFPVNILGTPLFPLTVLETVGFASTQGFHLIGL